MENEINNIEEGELSLSETKTMKEPMQWLDDMLNIVKNKSSGGNLMDDHFYLTLINNKLSQIASNMRVSFEHYDGGTIPANFYSFLLATSGASKGKTNSTLENLFFNEFKNRFAELFKDRSKLNRQLLAENRSIKEGMPEDQALAAINKRYFELPKYLYTYNDATEAGFKAIREKLTIASLGAVSVELDEIGINMHKVEEFLSSILEVYDVGKLKQKLIKMDSSEDTVAIPASFLSFGTGSTLLDGGEMEKKFNNLLRQGMSRRCGFSFTEQSVTNNETLEDFDPLSVLLNANSTEDNSTATKISDRFYRLADEAMIETKLTASKDIWSQVLVYKRTCEIEAAKLSEFDDLEAANLAHSYWVMTKLMAIYAFADGSNTMEQPHFDRALAYIENSKANFKALVKRKTNFERIATFITSSSGDLTRFDLIESLPFFKSGTKQGKEEMLDLAQSYAATHNMVIKHTVKEGIDYYSGSKLDEVDTNKISLSWSTDITERFETVVGKWEDLHQVPKMKNYSNHSYKKGVNNKNIEVAGYRNKENAIPGFNLVILDIDSGVDIKTAIAILEGQKFLISTTRSHQVLKNGETRDRYRIFLPMKYRLNMDPDEFSQFMANIMEDFPIECDEACKDISRFYFPNKNAEHWYGEGELFDPSDYIPDTKVNNDRVTRNLEIGDLSLLEKHFIKKMKKGGRNNELLKYAMVLVDAGENYENIEDRLMTLNRKTKEPMTQREISTTILKTVRKKMYSNEGN